jgi:hypothetical protein
MVGPLAGGVNSEEVRRADFCAERRIADDSLLLLQLRVFGLRVPQDGDVGAGVFPEVEGPIAIARPADRFPGY